MKQLDMNVLKGIAGGESMTCHTSQSYFSANNEFLFSVSMNIQVAPGSDCASVSRFVRMDDPVLQLKFMDKLKGAVKANPGGNVSVAGVNTFNSRPLEVFVGGSADAIAKAYFF